MTYQFGDRVRHPEYGHCIFEELHPATGKVYVLSQPPIALHRMVDITDLTPADPRIVKIEGVWHRIYGPFEGPQAVVYNLEGRKVYYTGMELSYRFTESSGIFEGLHEKGDYVIRYADGTAVHWPFIAVPVDEPDKKQEPPVTITEFCRFLETHTDWYEHTLDQIKKEREVKP